MPSCTLSHKCLRQFYNNVVNYDDVYDNRRRISQTRLSICNIALQTTLIVILNNSKVDARGYEIVSPRELDCHMLCQEYVFKHKLSTSA